MLVTVIFKLLIGSPYDRHQEQEKDREKTNYFTQ